MCCITYILFLEWHQYYQVEQPLLERATPFDNHTALYLKKKKKNLPKGEYVF